MIYCHCPNCGTPVETVDEDAWVPDHRRYHLRCPKCEAEFDLFLGPDPDDWTLRPRAAVLTGRRPPGAGPDNISGGRR